MLINVSGTKYECVHDFGRGRAIINMEGVFALVDQVDTNEWELSGEPARENEKAILNSLVATVENSTTVTAPDGTVTTFADEGGSVKR